MGTGGGGCGEENAAVLMRLSEAWRREFPTRTEASRRGGGGNDIAGSIVETLLGRRAESVMGIGLEV